MLMVLDPPDEYRRRWFPRAHHDGGDLYSTPFVAYLSFSRRRVSLRSHLHFVRWPCSAELLYVRGHEHEILLRPFALAGVAVPEISPNLRWVLTIFRRVQLGHRTLLCAFDLEITVQHPANLCSAGTSL